MSIHVLAGLICTLLLRYASALHLASVGADLASDVTDYDTMLWLGQDVSEESDHARSLKTQTLQLRSEGLPYEVLGAFDSGTNLMGALIHHNFPTAGHETRNNLHIWKHSNSGANSLYKTLSSIPKYNISDVVLIAMVRSPLAQLDSWKATPYDLEACVHRKWSDWGQPCTASVQATLVDTQFAVEEGRLHSKDPIPRFESTMEVYNSYIRYYQQLKKDRRFRKIAIIPYEDVVFEPERIVQKLAQLLELPVPEKAFIPDRPSKSHGHAVGRTGALEALKYRAWLERVGPHQAVVCQPPHGIDRELVADIVDLHNHSYFEDCIGTRRRRQPTAASMFPNEG